MKNLTPHDIVVSVGNTEHVFVKSGEVARVNCNEIGLGHYHCGWNHKLKPHFN